MGEAGGRVPPKKTWKKAGKIHLYFLNKSDCFFFSHCHVSFPECMYGNMRHKPQTSPKLPIPSWTKKKGSTNQPTFLRQAFEGWVMMSSSFDPFVLWPKTWTISRMRCVRYITCTIPNGWKSFIDDFWIYLSPMQFWSPASFINYCLKLMNLKAFVFFWGGGGGEMSTVTFKSIHLHGALKLDLQLFKTNRLAWPDFSWCYSLGWICQKWHLKYFQVLESHLQYSCNDVRINTPWSPEDPMAKWRDALVMNFGSTTCPSHLNPWTLNKGWIIIGTAWCTTIHHYCDMHPFIGHNRRNARLVLVLLGKV